MCSAQSGTRQVELAVIGAGPAGVAAALQAARLGVKTIVLDEQARPGGRMLSQVHAHPKRKGEWINGPSVIAELVGRARQAGVELVSQAEVWGLWPGWTLAVAGPGGAVAPKIEAQAVLLATGAAQSGLPFPGWTLPGVISAGAAQVMLHQHRVPPGRRALVVGVDPLALAVAQELPLLQVEVAGVVLPPPGPAVGSLASPRQALAGVARLAGLASSPLLGTAAGVLRRVPGLGARLYPREGLRVQGIPLMLRRCIVEAVGDTTVEEAVLADLTPDGRIIPGSHRTALADVICVSGGLYPLVELAETGGDCRLAFVEELGGRVPVHGPDMQTTASGLFVAGSASGVEGSQVAIAQGTLAGIGIAAFLGRIPGPEAPGLLARAAKGVQAARRQAPLSFHPDVQKGRARVAKLWYEFQPAHAAP